MAFGITPKGLVAFQSSPLVVLSLFRVLAVSLINKCYENIVKETIMSHAVKIFKDIFLHISTD